MTRFILSLLIAAIAVPWCGAKRLSPDDALGRVTSSTAMKLPGASGRKLVYTQHLDGEPALYVFGSPDAPGFLIVSASDATEAMLGYSDSSVFSPSDMPPALRWMMECYAAEVNEAETAVNLITEPAKQRIRRADVAPLTATLWNQDAPYNDLCPTLEGKKAPTGCVATAMAQVMKYHNWPARGTGSHSYRLLATGDSLRADFGATEYAWADMLNVYDGSATEAQNQAVATLMYQIGVAVNMNYTPDESGSNYFSGAEALVRYFGYDKGLTCRERAYYPLDEWIDMIYYELSEGRPVLYGGSNTSAGHAFVFDGYRGDGGDYFHVNWGWGGMSDGYFLVSALNPQSQGIGGSSAGYNTGQNIIIGIRPPVEGSGVVPIVRMAGDFAVTQEVYTRTDGTYVEVNVPSGIYAGSVETLTFTPGVQLEDSEGNISFVDGASGEVSLAMNHGIGAYYIAASALPQEGTYTVTPSFLTTDGVHLPMYVSMDRVRALQLTATAESLTFSSSADNYQLEAENLTLGTPVYDGRPFSITATVRNSGKAPFYGQLVPVLTSGNNVVAQGVPTEANITAGNTASLTWVSEFSTDVTPGDYTLYLLTSSGIPVSEGVAVTVLEEPESQGEVTVDEWKVNGTALSSTGRNENSPAKVTLSDQTNVEIGLTCTSGVYISEVSVYVFGSSNEMVTTLGSQFVSMTEGESQNLQFTADLSALDPQHTYILVPWNKGGQLGYNFRYITGDTSSADIPEADSDGNAEYFNLQGVKITNPHGGVFIRRTPSGTTKVVIP